MMLRRKNNGMVFLLKPFFILFLFFSLFGLVWLRSSIMTTAYELRSLEEKRMGMIKEREMLLAERAKLMSLEKINASFQGKSKRTRRYAVKGYIFPERSRVVHVKKRSQTTPYKVSMKKKSSK